MFPIVSSLSQIHEEIRKEFYTYINDGGGNIIIKNLTDLNLCILLMGNNVISATERETTIIDDKIKRIDDIMLKTNAPAY